MLVVCSWDVVLTEAEERRMARSIAVRSRGASEPSMQRSM